MKLHKSIIMVAFALSITFMMQRCTTKTQVDTVYATDPKITDLIVPNSEVPVPLNFVLDTSWVFAKVHSNVGYSTRYEDFGNTMLTGRFQEFQFAPSFSVPPTKLGGIHTASAAENINYNPAFVNTRYFPTGVNIQGPPSYFYFNANNLSANYMKAYVLVSTCCTSEPGRDSYVGCGQGYTGTNWTDSTRQVVDANSDTAWLVARPNTWHLQGNGYTVTCDFIFNRYMPTAAQGGNGSNVGTPISKPVTVYVTYNGQADILKNGGPAGTYYTGFSATFKFNRSDFMDKTSTKTYLPTPKLSEKANSDAAYTANKTFGVWSSSTADEMTITANCVFTKAHL